MIFHLVANTYIRIYISPMPYTELRVVFRFYAAYNPAYLIFRLLIKKTLHSSPSL